MVNVKHLAVVIDLIAKRMPGGISALLGQREAPTREELQLTLWKPSAAESVSVSHDVNFEKIADEAITQVMMWEILDEVEWVEITKAVQYYSTCPLHARSWLLYSEYATLYGLVRVYGSGSLADTLADKYGVSVRSVYRVLKHVPKNIALLALNDAERLPNWKG